MKRISKLLPVVVLLILASCAGPGENRAEILERLKAGEIPEAVDVYVLDVENSQLAWEGRRIVAGGHDGVLGIKKGEFYVFDGELLGGEVVVDMQQIVVLDIEDPENNARLKGHLESDDFFAVEKYPEARFEITSAEELQENDNGYTHRIFGNMTIRGITHGIAFNGNIELGEDRLVSFSDFDLDRTRWNVRFGSGRFFDDLGDRAISDNFNLKLDIVASRL